MTFRRLFVLPLLLLVVALNAEASVWSKTLDGVGGDNGQSASPTSDGGAILSGTTKDGYESYLIKMNSTGNIQWQKIFGRTGVNNFVQLRDAIQTSDGYVAVGTVLEALVGSLDLFVVKTDPQGIVKWMHIYSDSEDQNGYRIRQMKDGGFMVAAFTWYPTTITADLLLFRLDPNGNIVWQKILDGGGYDALPDLQTTTDGRFILSAFTTSFGNGRNALVIKFDDDGNIIWSKTYGGLGFEGAYGIQQTGDGGYAVTGWFKDSGNNKSDDLWLMKLSPSGKIQWQYQFGGSKTDTGARIAVARDGNLFVTGYTSSFGSGNEDIWILKFNPAGKILFEKTYGGVKGDWAQSARLAPDGGIFITGLNQLPLRIRQSAFVVKLNPTGELNTCSRLTLASSKAKITAVPATYMDVQLNIQDANLQELASDGIRISNGMMKSVTDCNLITGVIPSAATPGSVIELTGVGFGNSQADSKVFIGKRDTGSAISWSDTKIIMRLPKDSQTAGLTFQNTSGKTVPIEFPILPPVGKKLWPLDGPSQGKTRVAIPLPANLDGSKIDKVLFGTIEATNISLVSKNLLVCTSPAGTGSVEVTVFSATDSFNAGNFVYK
ncbi:MAG TPA: IPT/TIG domain-containing protein [Acidobacteriota bacterium]|nr:IPT/TIG domain-containing protein [Acidobacteriota bacterium]